MHISLRDVVPAAVIKAVNIVDDPDHVCRERTSVHLAEQMTGDREFIAGTIGGILNSGDTRPRSPYDVTIFSPFGLGVLDLALGALVRREAEQRQWGIRVDDLGL